MKKRYWSFRNLRDLSLPERLIHTTIIFGLPLFLWELIDLWREARENVFFGTGELVSGIAISAIVGILASVIFALIEHAFFTIKRKKKSDTV